MKKIVDLAAQAMLAALTNDTVLCFVAALVLVGGIFWLGGR